MSTTEIMNELPSLPVQDLETIYFRAAALMDTPLIEETPEMLAAIDEAEASYAKEGGVSETEMRGLVDSWKTTK